MSPELKRWIDTGSECCRAQAEFRIWLFVEASGVILGKKTGELLMIRKNRSALSVKERIHLIVLMCDRCRLSHAVLYRCEDSARVIVYERERLLRDLAQVPPWVFNRLAYPQLSYGLEAEDFLERIGQRWQDTGKIPHEIGLCLGYPIKDVLGFMGLVDLPCTGCCGWRVYGCPDESIMLYRRYRDARCQAELLSGGINERNDAPEEALHPVFQINA